MIARAILRLHLSRCLVVALVRRDAATALITFGDLRRLA